MKVLVTLDYYDARESKTVELDLSEISLNSFAFKMMQAGICGFTVVKSGNLIRQIERSKESLNKETP